MANKDDRLERAESIPGAKRTGREGTDPHSQPGEFADDMRANRTTSPPEPHEEEKKK